MTAVANYDPKIKSWRWRLAWDPIQTVLHGFLFGFLAGAITLLPLGYLLGSMALLVVVLFPVVGTIAGFIVWKLSADYVAGSYEKVLSQFYESQATQTGKEYLWLTQLKRADSQYGLEAAATYDFTRVHKTADEVKMADISLDLASLETTEQSTTLPMERVQSILYQNETLIVDARSGRWCFEGIKNTQEGDSQALKQTPTVNN